MSAIPRRLAELATVLGRSPYDPTPRTAELAPSDPLDHAIRIAVENVERDGGPFGAVVVLPDGRAAHGVNRVTDSLDPTAHAEVSAIRAACKLAGTFNLTGAVLYTSCHPCPMCLAASMWARLDRIEYAATPEEAAWGGFDDRAFYDQMQGLTPLALTMVKGEHRMDQLAPFSRWRANDERTTY